MKRFQVDVKEIVLHTVQVEAEDEEAAKVLALETIGVGEGTEIDSAFDEHDVYVEELEVLEE